jgi:hypothetical protein
VCCCLNTSYTSNISEQYDTNALRRPCLPHKKECNINQIYIMNIVKRHQKRENTESSFLVTLKPSGQPGKQGGRRTFYRVKLVSSDSVKVNKNYDLRCVLDPESRSAAVKGDDRGENSETTSGLENLLLLTERTDHDEKEGHEDRGPEGGHCDRGADGCDDHDDGDCMLRVSDLNFNHLGATYR